MQFSRLSAIALSALLAAAPMTAANWIWDRNDNDIDDRIESVHSNGLSAAFEGGDVTRRAIIAVDSSSNVLRYGVMVAFERPVTDADVAAIRATGVDMRIFKKYQTIPYVRMSLTFAEIQKVAAISGVEKVEALEMMYAVNNIATKTSGATDSNFRHFPSVQKNLGITGKGVVVSILDTGVNDTAQPTGYPGHESFTGKFIAGGNFYTGEPALNTANDASENPTDLGEEASSNHGTHVAGTTLGTGGPTKVFGGVAPDALLVDQKVLSDAGLGFGSADGVEWAIINKDKYRIRVLNLSLGGLSASDGRDANSRAMNAAFDAGLFPIVAAGNDSKTDYMPSPAAADKAFTIGALADQNSIQRKDDLVASFSNEGPRMSDGDADFEDEMKPLVGAPGSGIVSAHGSLATDGRQYVPLSGTSMATPHVAGIVALILEANPALGPQQVWDILKHTSEHRNNWGKTLPTDNPYPQGDPNYHPSAGWGQVDAYAAVKEALRLKGDKASQTQVVFISASAATDAIELTWRTQRETSLAGFDVYRAEDVGGAPGPWTKLTATSIPGIGSAIIERTNNRNTYTYRDASGLVAGTAYWYRIDHTSTDPAVGTISEPAYAISFGQVRPIARINYSITHNAIDNDLLVLIGSGAQAERAKFIVDGKSALQADSVVVDPGEATTGNRRHLFSIDLTSRDDVARFLPPSKTNPWFIAVKEGGFINRAGRVDAFSITTFDANGNAVQTYSTRDVVPQRTVEGQTTYLWIPDNPNVFLPGDKPTVIEAAPSSGSRGETVKLEVFGAEFLPGATLSVSGNGVTVSSVDVKSGTQINATLTIAPNATPGPRDITVRNVDGGTGVAKGAFSINGSNNGGTIVDLDDNDPAIEYRNGWHVEEYANASNGGYHVRQGNGNGKKEPTARLVFDGTQITYFYGTSTKGGSADVYLDGALVKTVSYTGTTKEPTFGDSITFADLASGSHEIRIVHKSGAAFIDGFQIVGDAKEEAVEARSTTSSSTTLVSGSTLIVRTVNVTSSDEHLSVVVEGGEQPLSVTVLSPAGLPVATGGALIEGTTLTGVDTSLPAGTYTVQAIGAATMAPSNVEVSIARTVRVK